MSTPAVAEQPFKIYVGNLTWKTQEADLYALFGSCGNGMSPMRLVQDGGGETGKSRGFGFVTFSTQEEAMFAIQTLHGHELDGRALKVNLANESRQVFDSRVFYGMQYPMYQPIVYPQPYGYPYQYPTSPTFAFPMVMMMANEGRVSSDEHVTGEEQRETRLDATEMRLETNASDLRVE